jgi:predicted glycogen debranching enzyme
MDARVGDYVVTPRHGCPVEIQALWYNALRIYQHFAELLDKPYAVYSEVADRCARHFKAKFMHPDGYLYDLLEMKDGTWVADASFRPNQLYVVSLPFSLLKPAEEKKLVELVGERLLTPYGLRTLSTDHPDFKPVYEGDQWHRDTAYHQGTVWPFLMGEYITAYLKVHKKSEKTRSHIVALLEPLKQHFYKSEGVFCISEVFDGLSPQTGKGTIQQAWSVSAVLKALLDLKTI